MPSLSPLKLIGLGVGLLALVGLVAMVLGWRSERNELRQWQVEVLVATRSAAANPALGKNDVAKQIEALGRSVRNLEAGIAAQNAGIDRLKAEQDRQRAASAKASRIAQERARRTGATITRLDASSRSPERLAKPCEPSRTLQEAW